MNSPIHGPFAQMLEAGRERFNALFAQARRDTPRLDPALFAEHLVRHVAPIVEQVARTEPAKVGEVTEVLYELSLELVGKEFLGPRTRYPALADGWGQLLRELPRHLAAAPRRFAGSVSNALYNLCIVPDARPAEWTDTMLRLGPHCADVSAFLDAGKVVAWRAGLAHYRDGALAVCDSLKPALVLDALGVPENDAAAVPTIVSRLRDDPWLHPAAAGRRPDGKQLLRIVARVGAFRGFGGPFLRPPRVALADGQFFVADGESCWLLAADVFGATFHRSGNALPDGARSDVYSEPKGKLATANRAHTLDELQYRQSYAATATTLAVTIPLSHAVYLVALTEPSP